MLTNNEFLLNALKNIRWRVRMGDKVRWWNPLSWGLIALRPSNRLCHELYSHFAITNATHPILYDAFNANTQTGSRLLPVKNDNFKPGGNWAVRWSLSSPEGVNRRKFLDDLITYVEAAVEKENAQ